MKAGSGPMMSTGGAGAVLESMGGNTQVPPVSGILEGVGDNDFSFSLPGKLYLGLKRIFDIGISLLALGIFGLMLPLLSLIIKLDSPGSVFFSQERVGLNRRRVRSEFDGQERRKVLQPGRPFKVLKLRTMGVNAEANGPQWAAQNDVRVTRVGRYLRKTRLDEVPQFLNVLRGEMSLIGPRPERLVFVRQLEKEIPHYHQRLLVLPGITGLAQVVNGYDDSLDSVRRKIELDRQYIKKAGFRQDSQILLNTVSVVLKGDGAR
ncbi:MAG: sugar transferase [Candidatus Krumholzibacteria bacterium]|nr:sugar transferase [Candidatus Krumholzibacteria bacterium]